jgi:hypothetical protein
LNLEVCIKKILKSGEHQKGKPDPLCPSHTRPLSDRHVSRTVSKEIWSDLRLPKEARGDGLGGDERQALVMHIILQEIYGNLGLKEWLCLCKRNLLLYQS